jgi:hypothetical protein
MPTRAIPPKGPESHASSKAQPSMQAGVLLAATSALTRMATAVWPGFTSEGPAAALAAAWLSVAGAAGGSWGAGALSDLTSPAVLLPTLSTPGGTLGALPPLVLLLAYLHAVDASVTGEGFRCRAQGSRVCGRAFTQCLQQ